MNIPLYRTIALVLAAAPMLGGIHGCGSETDKNMPTGETSTAQSTTTNSDNTTDAGDDADTSESATHEEIESNPDLELEETDDPGGVDTSAFAGVWDGSLQRGDALDTVYWELSINGILTRYDYQGDGVEGASGENCYTRGDPIKLTAESGDDFLIGSVATSITRVDDILTITFRESDSADLDQDNDIDEAPVLEWPLSGFITSDELMNCV